MANIVKKLYKYDGKLNNGEFPVKIYVYASKKVRFYNTGISVEEQFWDDSHKKVKKSHTYHKQLNGEIEHKYVEVKWHFDNGGTHKEMKALLNGVKPSDISSQTSFVLFLQELIGDINMGKVANIKHAKLYQNLLTRLKQYFKHKQINDLSFDDINMSFYYEYKDFLYDIGNKDSGVDNHIKAIISVMNKALDKELHNNMAYEKKAFARIRSSSEKIYLTEAEIKDLMELDLTKLEYLQRERDRFIVQYYFLLRISDVKRLKKDWFFMKDDNYYIRITHQQKTKNEAILPVKPMVQALLEKYEYDFSFTTDNEANKLMKIVAFMAGINHEVTEGTICKPKCQFVTTHTARRSGATNLYLRKTPLKVIQDLGGWRSVTSMMTYIRASGIDSAILASDLDFFK